MSRRPLPPVPLLSAPTAAGKTALALRLAEEFPVEIVAADAFTVYRGLDVGTAKPTRAERARVPHHLIDVVEVEQPYDVTQFAAAAESAIADVLARGRIPLVVGGTGLYLSALQRGLPRTPPSDPRMRAAVEAELTERGLDALLAEIARHSPAEAARMERNPRRVVRALEVHRSTGRFPGEFGYAPPRFGTAVFAFTPELTELERRIAVRTTAMLGSGWAREAAWLAGRVSPDTRPRPTVWQALGYLDALALSRGECDAAQASEKIVLATRQYTKRQLTWLRRQLHATLLSPGEAEEQLRSALRAWR